MIALIHNTTEPKRLHSLLERLELSRTWLDRFPYSIQLYIEQASTYQRLGYPDLAAGAAYKALLLSDSVNDDCDEYYTATLADILRACNSLPSELVSTWSPLLNITALLESFNLNADDEDEDDLEDLDDEEAFPIVDWVNTELLPNINVLLAENLYACQCYRSAYKYCQIGLRSDVDNSRLLNLRDTILKAVQEHLCAAGESTSNVLESLDEWPDVGLVRRERYTWNSIEPDRFSDESLDFLNAEMAKCAPKFEVKAVDLPLLSAEGDTVMVKQLGVFAKEDVQAGESVLRETSLLTANNRLQDALCDACGKDIEDSGPSRDEATMCVDCPVLFCSQECHDMADEQYHPAVCDRDVDSIARDVPPAQAADSLYLLLLLRSFALAETQETHPLELKEVKYIWGDYHFADVAQAWKSPQEGGNAFANLPRSLRFSFDSSVVLPYHMLTKMDVDIFREHRRYDVWTFNTVYAKFRGTASARLSGVSRTPRGLKLGRIRGPEVSAVHPCWCLANHSCDPNVQWEWGGRIEFTTRQSRPEWKQDHTGKTRAPADVGIKKGDEVWNHYCDISLDVQKRREWASGALGGDCRCERCIWEANE